jgi:dUTP pyrophosphatase
MLRYLQMFTIYLPKNLVTWTRKTLKKFKSFSFKSTKQKTKDNIVKIVSNYIPQQKTEGAAAFDLTANLGNSMLLFRAGETHLVSTGVKIEIPKGKCGLILIRSGLSIQSPLGLANGIGLIDSDYRGEILVPLRNYSATKRHTIVDGERIAQLLIVDYFTPTFVRVKNLEETKRGVGGFGSTGAK